MAEILGATKEKRRKKQARLHVVRAAVLGASDGIVEIAGLVVGVAAASPSTSVILIAGVAGALAGAFSMGASEYASAHSQLDAEKAAIEAEKLELAMDPTGEERELMQIYVEKGLSHNTALQVARELTNHDAFEAHADAELGIDPHAHINPWSGAISSLLSFMLGSIIPLIAIIISPAEWRIPITVLVVILALTLTGSLSASAGEARKIPAVFRVIIGGLIAIGVTYAVGQLIG